MDIIGYIDEADYIDLAGGGAGGRDAAKAYTSIFLYFGTSVFIIDHAMR